MTETSSTLWQLNNHSHHFVINSGANVDVALDYVNLLESDEELTSVSVTTTSGTLTLGSYGFKCKVVFFVVS